MRYQEQIKRIDKIAWLLCRSCQRLRFRAGMTCMFAAAWWGVLYPELCFTEETCQAVVAAGEEAGEPERMGKDIPADSGTVQQETAGGSAGSEDEKLGVKEQVSYQELWKCTDEDIVIRSRLLEWLKQYAGGLSE